MFNRFQFKGGKSMDLIKRYKLVENKAGSYDVILCLDTGSMDVEFADEFGKLDKDNSGLKQSIIQQISEKFPNLTINTVKIMIGTVLFSSFIMGIPTSVQASESTPGGTK
jgi:hypothetical protein